MWAVCVRFRVCVCVGPGVGGLRAEGVENCVGRDIRCKFKGVIPTSTVSYTLVDQCVWVGGAPPPPACIRELPSRLLEILTF